MGLQGRDLISGYDLDRKEVEVVFAMADELRSESRKDSLNRLPGCSLAMIFQKPSTRTRVSFETGISQLGGHGLFLSADDMQLRRGETIADTARTLSRYVDAIMIRTYDHQDVIDLARYADIPVINGLTDLLHPCQALADFYTIRQKLNGLQGLKLAYVGDGNNVAHSLMITAAIMGTDIVLATPNGFEPDKEIVGIAREIAAVSGSKVELTDDPMAAVEGANAIYTDVWASMGQEEEALLRRAIFRNYQINDEKLEAAAPEAIVLHCLPAHRGEEITDSVIDGAHSVVFDQAENRLHIQKAIMYLVMS
ncbi:MAG: ornithine carbamoyltransferase [bacterium]|jgi:ornithine carbamoyltransferase|nr:ornithine carbamoyltransferase [bacterium]MDD3805515.1 ornithine carbamoyltransferase [bacterium]MDD4153179.1 ornithine carbamoyltransferase [bacterium]